MAMASNEPYNRVSRKDNGVLDGALIGGGIGLVGAGGTVMGARAHYNGIDRRSEKGLAPIADQEATIENRRARDTERYERKVDQASRPNRFERSRYETASETSGERGSRRYLDKVNTRMQNRIDKVKKKHDSRMEAHDSNMASLQERRASFDPRTMRSKHMYNRMGGWRNAGIIGASAIVGAGLGMVSDGAYEKVTR